MPIDLNKLQKIETPSPSQQAGDKSGNVLVLLKMADGSAPPDFVRVRGPIADGLYSAEVAVADLPRLDAHPAVQSFSISKPASRID
ncbi:MAG TPA: hypothetical protein VFE64_02285 [Devosia sp.]|jgi:hypothetical protein|nr:hypothetical protein [Devosia sp.]